MICHLTIGPIPGHDGDGNSIAYFNPCPCMGSDCALWVPEYGSKERKGIRVEGSFGAQQASDGTCYPFTEPTGKGWCAANLRREPAQDPAKETP